MVGSYQKAFHLFYYLVVVCYNLQRWQRLFTNIQLDSFNETMVRFIERLAIESAEDGVTNGGGGASLEYGRAGGIIRRFWRL